MLTILFSTFPDCFVYKVFARILIRNLKKHTEHIHVHAFAKTPGPGKTVVMSEIARRATVKNRRVLFLIHRKEVLEQANATFKEQGVDFDLLTSTTVHTALTIYSDFSASGQFLHAIRRQFLDTQTRTYQFHAVR